MQMCIRDRSISLNFEEPIASFDTAAIHLRQKVDTLWKDIPFEFEQDSVNLKKFNLYYDWEPTLEYEFSVDSVSYTHLDVYKRQVQLSGRIQCLFALLPRLPVIAIPYNMQRGRGRNIR